MKASEIRIISDRIREEIGRGILAPESQGYLQTAAQFEIAAQLADLNRNLSSLIDVILNLSHGG